MLRNLLYNCCPLKVSEHVWRDNIKWLCRYPHAFNGKKIVNIKTGIDMEDPKLVKPLFAALKPVEFVLVPNDSTLHELAGFIEGWKNLKSYRADEITFYAHTKGVRKYECSDIEQLSVRQWRNRMYDECLSHPLKIESILKKHSACGCFVCQGQYGRHFAGTFYWINHARLFSKSNWQSIPNTRFGPEEYIAIQFDPKHLYDLRAVNNIDKITFYTEARGIYKCLICNQTFEAIIQKQLYCPYCDETKTRRYHKRHGENLVLIEIPEMGF